MEKRDLFASSDSLSTVATTDTTLDTTLDTTMDTHNPAFEHDDDEEERHNRVHVSSRDQGTWYEHHNHAGPPRNIQNSTGHIQRGYDDQILRVPSDEHSQNRENCNHTNITTDGVILEQRRKSDTPGFRNHIHTHLSRSQTCPPGVTVNFMKTEGKKWKNNNSPLKPEDQDYRFRTGENSSVVTAHLSECNPLLLWQRELTARFPQTIWVKNDINLDKSAATYRRRLQKQAAIEVIRDELHHVCRMKFVNRLHVICQHITEDRQLALHDESLCGATYGETVLHIALMFGYLEMAEILLTYGSTNLIMKGYTHKTYKGVTSLHLAVVYNMRSFIDQIMMKLTENEEAYLVNREALGSFFREKFCASGLPLGLAIWCGHKELMNDLIRYGAIPDRCEATTGNNILHSLVEYSAVKPKTACKAFTEFLDNELIYEWYLRMTEKSPRDENINDKDLMKLYFLKVKNHCGFTPLTLACRLGASEMVNLILHIKNIYMLPQWQYGHASLCYYNVSELETLDTTMRPVPSWPGIQLLNFSTGTKNMEVFTSPPIKRYIQMKWRAYIFWYYLLAIYHLIVMATFTYCTLETSGNSSALHVAYFFILVYVILQLIRDAYRIYSNIVPWIKHIIEHHSAHIYTSTLSITSLAGFHHLLTIFSIITVIWYISKVVGSPHAEAIAAPAILLGWYYMVFFLRNLRRIGIFTAIFHRVLLTSVLNFAIVYLLIWFAYSVVFQSLVLPATVEGATPELNSLSTTMWTVFKASLGYFELGDDFNLLKYPSYARFLLLTFTCMTLALVVNAVVTAISDIYGQLSQSPDAIWRKLLIETVLSIETGLPPILRPKSTLRKNVIFHGQETEAHVLLVDVQELSGPEDDCINE